MTMITLMIDPETCDLVLSPSGELRTIDNYSVQATQALQLALRTWLREWELDESYGTD